MGRKGSGVERREASIRLTFTIEGVQQRHTLMLAGRPMLPTPANLKYAHNIAAEIREKVRHGAFVLAEYFPDACDTLVVAGTVSEQIDAWLDTQRIEASTRAGYDSAAKFWKHAASDKKLTPVGSRPLRTLLTGHLLYALATRPDLSGKTINNYVSVLRESLALAVLDKMLTSNPTDDVPRAKFQKPPPDPFSREEADKIVAAMSARFPAQVANLVATWFWTGMRTSEIVGLRWSNVNLAAATLSVTEAQVRGVRKLTTKTNATRTVKLNRIALAALERQAVFTAVQSDAVFHDPRYDQPWNDERAFRRSFWTPTLKDLGIRYRRPYNMRHTYATVMLMAGMNHLFCAKQLGHSVEMLLGTYSKWIDGKQNDREMKLLEGVLSSPVLPQEPKSDT